MSLTCWWSDTSALAMVAEAWQNKSPSSTRTSTTDTRQYTVQCHSAVKTRPQAKIHNLCHTIINLDTGFLWVPRMPHSQENFANTKSQNRYPNHEPRGFTKSRKVHFSKVQTLDNASKYFFSLVLCEDYYFEALAHYFGLSLLAISCVLNPHYFYSVHFRIREYNRYSIASYFGGLA